MKSSLPPSAPMEPSTWSPPVRRSWPQRLLRGWGLVLTICVLLGLYFLIRGKKEYWALKAAWSHHDVRKSQELNAAGDVDGAIKYLQKAGARTPYDPVVLRALADFNEPLRLDGITLFALRQLVNTGQATAEDRERLCRLAYEWGKPELADTETLREWALSDVSKLELRPLELSARWMATRGQARDAEERLEGALKLAEGHEAEPAIKTILTRLKLSRIPQQSVDEALLKQCQGLMVSVLQATEPPKPAFGDAAKLLASMALTPAWTPHFTPELTDLARKSLLAQAAACEPQSVAALELRLLEATLQIHLEPDRKEALAESMGANAEGAPVKTKAILARWMINRDVPARAIAICESVPDHLKDREWFTIHMDALHMMKSWDELKQQLASPTQPLPPIVRAMFLLTIDKSAGASAEVVAHRRTELEELIPRADVREAINVAGVLENTREYLLAMSIYRTLENHAQAGLPSRLGMVRCLSTQLDRTSALIDALNSLLVLWPRSDEARSDLASLRLLERTHRQEDVQAVISLTNANPWYLAYRIPAALALLRSNDPAKALKLLAQADVPWEKARPGWVAVYAATLAANQRMTEARRWSATINAESLRPGEKRLLEEYALSPKS